MRLLFLVLLIVACEKSGTNEHTLFQAAPAVEGGVDFATLKSFVLTPMCVRCHGWVNDEAQVATRIVAGDPESSSLYVRMANGTMPQGGPVATTAQLEVVAAYINGPATTNPPPPTAIELKPTYASLKVHLFEKSCTMCHSPGKRRPDLTDLEEIRDEIDDIAEQLDFGMMPPQGPLPEDEVLDTFREWVSRGMPR